MADHVSGLASNGKLYKRHTLSHGHACASQVAIFDATNTTNERRQLLIERFHGTYQYLFIESICTGGLSVRCAVVTATFDHSALSLSGDTVSAVSGDTGTKNAADMRDDGHTCLACC